MKFHLVSLGCARNQVDSEVMRGRLKRRGWQATPDPEQARVIIINTCSFIESAANESIDTILSLAELKTTGACKRLVVVGCLPERYREDIVATLPEVDCFLGTGAFDQIEKVVAETAPTEGCLLPDPNARLLEDGHTPRQPTDRHLAYVKIAEGCNSGCTYCIIPKLRGRHRSRPVADIVTEARHLIDGGARELVLVAQDTMHYGHDLTPKTDLARLLGDLAELSDTVWIRFLYGHPEHYDTSLVQTLSKYENLCPYFDIPIQHAADGILKKMGRRYHQRDLQEMFGHIRSRLPRAALRTSVIVGFPGETEEHFQKLLAFIDQMQFDHLGVFTYSDSDDLPSHRLPDPVSGDLARKRMNRIMELQKKISRDRNLRYRDEILPVLVEQQLEDHLFSARTQFQAPEVDGLTFVKTRPDSPRITVGSFARVKIIDTLEYDLVAEAQSTVS
jgi:ribosomal protein S12 methylthiotransferase